jgi:hypothetical protein
VGSDRDWGRRTIHGPYGRVLVALAATSLVFIVGYLGNPSPAGPAAGPAPASPQGQPDDGFSSASLSESGGCYFIRGFGLPVVASDGSRLEVVSCAEMIGSDRPQQRRHLP